MLPSGAKAKRSNPDTDSDWGGPHSALPGPMVCELGGPSSSTTRVTLPSAEPSSASRPSQQVARTVSAVHSPAVERVADRSVPVPMSQAATNSPFVRAATRGGATSVFPGSRPTASPQGPPRGR